MSKFFYKKLIFIFLVATLIVMPVSSFATNYVGAEPPNPNAIPNIATLMNTLVDLVWKVFFGIAVIMFILAGIEFLTSHGEPAKLSKAKAFVIWGIVGIVVAVAAFSIVKITTKLLTADPEYDACIAACDGDDNCMAGCVD